MTRMPIMIMALLLAGCASGGGERPVSTSAYQFRLGAGDVMHIDVYGEERLSKDYAVAGDGTVSIPLVGPLEARGLTLPDFKDLLVRELRAKVLRDPLVTVDMVKYRPVYILGEVNQPGEYPYSSQMSVMALVAKAGGFTFRANEKIVLIRHGGDATEIQYRLMPDSAIQPGDTVRIPRSIF